MGWYKKKPDLDHLSIRLQSESRAAKEIFFQMAKGSVRLVDEGTFIESARDGYVGAFARFRVDLTKTGRGTRVSGLQITVNRDDFGKRGRASIKPVIHHEVAEVHAVALGGWQDGVDTGGGIESQSCHKKALGEEFDYAFSKGVASSHIKYMLSKSGEFVDETLRNQYIEENIAAYEEAKRRFFEKKKTMR